MVTDNTNRAFSEGMALFRQNKFVAALEAFRIAYKENPRNPRHISYFGLTLVLHGHDFEHGLVLCREAMQAAPFDPETHVNLSRAYMRTGNKKRAFETLNQGLAFISDSKLIQSELERINTRRTLFLPFCRRENFLNRMAGKFTYLLTGKKSSPSPP